MTRRRDGAEAPLRERDRAVIVSYGFRGRASLQVVEVELPPGWFPGSHAERGLGPPAVVGRNEVSVRVPADGDRRLRLRDV